MVMLQESDIQTKEVLNWTGLHLFHFSDSTCSQKLRIYLRLKGISWTSHHINLARKEHLRPYYMGINPRGLVPTLVHNGKVVIESNDILQYLEREFPAPSLVPTVDQATLDAILKAEDDLHLDIRALTMRFVFPTFLAKRPEKDVATYEHSGSGTVAGVADAHRQREMAFWRNMNQHNGITDAQVKRAYERFNAALNRFELILSEHEHLAGDQQSVIDIAWYVYARRLLAARYPLATSHPAVHRWFQRLHAQPEYREEVPSKGATAVVSWLLHAAQRLKGSTLTDTVSATKSSA